MSLDTAEREVDYVRRLLSVTNLLTILTLGVCLFPQSASTQSEYTEQVLFTIPWGEELGHADVRWRTPPPADPYADGIWWAGGQWVVSDNDELIIFDAGEHADILKFSGNGSLLAHVQVEDIGLRFWTHAFAVNTSGELLLGEDAKLVLLDTDFSVLWTAELPDPDFRTTEIYPSDHGSFWIICVHGYFSRDRLVMECLRDGTISQPILIPEGEGFYITPDGSFHHNPTDYQGYEYSLYCEEEGNVLRKQSPEGEVVYTHCWSSDPGWTDYELLHSANLLFVAWSGDFYTIHATAEGAVVTKYALACE